MVMKVFVILCLLSAGAWSGKEDQTEEDDGGIPASRAVFGPSSSLEGASITTIMKMLKAHLDENSDHSIHSFCNQHALIESTVYGWHRKLNTAIAKSESPDRDQCMQDFFGNQIFKRNSRKPLYGTSMGRLLRELSQLPVGDRVSSSEGLCRFRDTMDQLIEFYKKRGQKETLNTFSQERHISRSTIYSLLTKLRAVSGGTLEHRLQKALRGKKLKERRPKKQKKVEIAAAAFIGPLLPAHRESAGPDFSQDLGDMSVGAPSSPSQDLPVEGPMLAQQVPDRNAQVVFEGGEMEMSVEDFSFQEFFDWQSVEPGPGGFDFLAFLEEGRGPLGVGF